MQKFRGKGMGEAVARIIIQGYKQNHGTQTTDLISNASSLNMAYKHLDYLVFPTPKAFGNIISHIFNPQENMR